MDILKMLGAANAPTITEAKDKVKVLMEMTRVVIKVRSLPAGQHILHFARTDGGVEEVYVKAGREVPEVGELCRFRVYEEEEVVVKENETGGKEETVEKVLQIRFLNVVRNPLTKESLKGM